jgi:hypothetical protein
MNKSKTKKRLALDVAQTVAARGTRASIAEMQPLHDTTGPRSG